MATATTKIETKTVETEVSDQVVKLELSLDEASVLKTLVGRVRGGPSTTWKHTNAIDTALYVAGVFGDNCCHFDYGTITAI